MPKGDFYKDLPLAEAVEKLANHHYAVKNRHISEDEYALLMLAVKALGATR